MRKRFIFLLLILIMFFGAGCNGKNSDIKANIFDIDEAVKISDSYMKELSLCNMSETKKLTDDKIRDDREFEKLKENKISGYIRKSITESTNHAYINYEVIRGNDEKLRSDLDTISIKVTQKDNNYVIDEIKAKNNKQVYVDKTFLRIRDDKSGKSEVLTRLKDLPREVYPKKQGVILGKEAVPEGQFNKVAIGFEGNKVGMTTTDGKKNFIAIAMVEDSKQTIGSAGGEESSADSEEDIDKQIDDALEKPIADKIVGYDIIDNSVIEKLVFSSDDGELLVQLRQGEKCSKIKVYKNPTGELLKLDLDKLFPEDKYDCTISRINNDGVFIDVSAITDEREAEGQYKIDIKAMKVDKL